MIFHIAFDSIFLDYTICQFEKIYPGESKYFIDIPEEDYKIKYIKQKEKITYILLRDPVERVKILSELLTAKVVIFHCLNNNMINLINIVPKHLRLIWVLWGAEINDLPKFYRRLMKPRTKSKLIELKEHNYRKEFYVKFPNIHYLAHKLKHKENHPDEFKIKAINRINYLGVFIKEDHELINKTYKTNLRWMWYCYYSIEQTIGKSFLNSKVNGKNILIGNSADPKNNHLDIFESLKNMSELANRRILVPLSYPDYLHQYVQAVIMEGEKYFGNNFYPLKTFISQEQYNALLRSCSIVIMNHNTQQAVGSIISSLWFGAKVYLNEMNTLYQYLKRIGLLIYSLQSDFKKESENTFKSLSDKEIAFNRKILMKHHSHEAVLTKIKEFIDKM